LLDLYNNQESVSDRPIAFHEALSEIVRLAPLEKLAQSVFNGMHNPKKKIRDDVIVLGVEV
jgi:hypothetical protein